MSQMPSTPYPMDLINSGQPLVISNVPRSVMAPSTEIKITIGQSLPKHEDYERECMRINFLEASYRGGPRYKTAVDSEGNPVLVEHDRESDAGRRRRMRHSVFVNHCRPIVRRFVDFVFRQDVQRDPNDIAWTEWCANVDGRSTPINPFMRTVMRKACVCGRYYLLADTTRTAGGVMTRAQAMQAGVRMVVKMIDPRRLVNWVRDSGILTSGLVVFEGGKTAILWNDTTSTFVTLDDQGRVTSVDPKPHGWPRMPLVEIAPFDQDSMIEDIAELNRDLFNHHSVEREELYSCTFTTKVAFGVRPSDLKGEDGGDVEQGSGKLICIPNKDAKVENIGGDPAQADSIRSTAHSVTTEIYRQAGLRAEDPMETTAPQSGIALKVRFDDLAAQLSGIAEEAQRVESEIVAFYNVVAAATVTAPKYPDQFGQPDAAVEIDRSLTILESPDIVRTAKRLEQVRLVNLLYPKAARKDMQDIIAEIEEKYAEPEPEAIGVAEMDTANKMQAILGEGQELPDDDLNDEAAVDE